MCEKGIYLLAAQMNEPAALFAFHVIALSVAAMLSTDVFVTCRRLFINDVLVDKAVSSQTVKTPVDSSLSDIDAL